MNLIIYIYTHTIIYYRLQFIIHIWPFDNEQCNYKIEKNGFLKKKEKNFKKKKKLQFNGLYCLLKKWVVILSFVTYNSSFSLVQ